MIKVGVIFGGKSVEHEVSIITAVQAMNKLNSEKYEIIPIYVTKDMHFRYGYPLREIEIYQDMDLLKRNTKEVVLYKKDNKVVVQKLGFFKRVLKELDIVLPIGHGTYLEDGGLQGFLKLLEIPYVGSDQLGAAVGQDKVMQKLLYEASGIDTIDFTWFYDFEYLDNKDKIIEKIEKLNYPVIVKPSSLGSSVGIKYAKDKESLEKAINEAMNYDSKIIVEKKVEHIKEVNISVLGNQDNFRLSPIEEVFATSEILSYEDKYISKSNKASKGMLSATRKIPADLSNDLKEKVEELAKKAFRVLGLSGVVRMDFLIDSKSNKVYLNEVNTIPGSLSFYLWEKANTSYTELLDELISLAVKNHRKKEEKINSFKSNILANFNGLKGMKGSKGSKLN